MGIKMDYGTILVIFFLYSLARDVEAACYSPESCLIEDLFTNYDAHVRPASAPGDQIVVNTTLYVRSLSNIDEKNEVMHLIGYFALDWFDQFLQWNPSDYNDTQYIILFAEDIWLPDVAILNSAENYYKATYKEDFRVIIFHDGSVQWSYGGILKTICNMDITEYPFDTQKCSIELENFVYPEILVDLELDDPPVASHDFEENSLWKLKKVVSARQDYSESLIDYPRLVFTFHWERKILYYSFNIILPTIFISAITLGVFWLPPACGEKISLGITVLLAFSVFQIIIMDNTPVNSDVTPRISKVVIFVMSMATVSLLSSMLTVYLDSRSDASRAPRWLRHVAFKIFARIFFLTAEIPNIDDSKVEPFLASVDKTTVENGVESSGVKHVTTPSEMAQILEKLEFITKNIKKKERCENIQNEWKLMAKILDRLLFWICFLIFLIYAFYTIGVVSTRDS